MSHSVDVAHDGSVYSLSFNSDLSGHVTITSSIQVQISPDGAPLPAVPHHTWKVEVPGSLLVKLISYPCLKGSLGSSAHDLAYGVEYQACERFKAHDDPAAHALRELARRIRALFDLEGGA